MKFTHNESDYRLAFHYWSQAGHEVKGPRVVTTPLPNGGERKVTNTIEDTWTRYFVACALYRKVDGAPTHNPEQPFHWEIVGERAVAECSRLDIYRPRCGKDNGRDTAFDRLVRSLPEELRGPCGYAYNHRKPLTAAKKLEGGAETEEVREA